MKQRKVWLFFFPMLLRASKKRAVMQHKQLWRRNEEIDSCSQARSELCGRVALAHGPYIWTSLIYYVPSVTTAMNQILRHAPPVLHFWRTAFIVPLASKAAI